jgi:hypothetical protein
LTATVPVIAKATTASRNRLEADIRQRARYQFRPLEIELNLLVNLEPAPLSVGMTTTAIKAEIKPYSIAVAPESFLPNSNRTFPMFRIFDKSVSQPHNVA